VQAEAVEAALLRRLSVWAAGSATAGSLLWAAGRRAERPAVAAFGRQNAAWGAVDGAIALAGTVRRRAGSSGADDDPARARKLRRVLLVNAWLDVGYLLAGAGMIAARHRADRLPRYDSAQAAGDGAAIILQGGFLLWLDATHARRLDGHDT